MVLPRWLSQAAPWPATAGPVDAEVVDLDADRHMVSLHLEREDRDLEVAADDRLIGTLTPGARVIVMLDAHGDAVRVAPVI